MIETLKIGTLKWYHILDPSDHDLQYLRDNFHFHPLDIEDCKSRNQRPKIDIYDDYYFLILHFPNFDRSNQFLKTKEVKIFWGEDFIITIGSTHWVVRALFNQAKENPDSSDVMEVGTSDALLYKILARLMTETLTLIRRIGTEVELINRELFDKRAEKTIERISITRKNIILLNTIFKPQLRLFHKFESGEIEGYASNMEDYWGDILDYYQKGWDMTEDFAELIEGLSKTFDSLQTNRINEIIRVLTLVSAILLPLTLIASLYGMNIDLPYQELPQAFGIIAAVMIGAIVTMVTYFKRKRWM